MRPSQFAFANVAAPFMHSIKKDWDNDKDCFGQLFAGLRDCVRRHAADNILIADFEGSDFGRWTAGG